MNSQIVNFLQNMLMIFLLLFCGSWFVGGLLTAIRDKKYPAIGLYIPLVLIWAKYMLLYLLIG